MSNSKRISRGMVAAGLAASLVLTACGGGGGDGTVSDSGTATSVGSISGFGSVIVNGVRFEDNAKQFTDDNENRISTDQLGLGMMVEVSGTVNDDGTGSASAINVFSEVQGPVSNLATDARTFEILGFKVSVTDATVFEDFLSQPLANGNTVEVHGTRNGDNIVASRIELKTPVLGDTFIKIRGQVANVTPSTFTIGTVTVNYESAQVSPNTRPIANEDYVKVRSTSAATGSNVTASRVQVVGSRPFGFADNGKSELEGVVSHFVSISQFSVGGIAVNAANAIFVRGDADDIANDKRLEVKGVYSNNVITASKVKFEDASHTDEFELHGAVSNFVSLSSFMVRGVKVDASGVGVLFERGLASAVANGRELEVEGSIQSTVSGSILRASKVKFEDLTGSNTATNAGELEFKGRVISISGSRDTMVVGTRTVTLTTDTVFRRMDNADIVVGAFLEIKGKSQSDGSVLAERVSLED